MFCHVLVFFSVFFQEDALFSFVWSTDAYTISLVNTCGAVAVDGDRRFVVLLAATLLLLPVLTVLSVCLSVFK